MFNSNKKWTKTWQNRFYCVALAQIKNKAQQ